MIFNIPKINLIISTLICKGGASFGSILLSITIARNSTLDHVGVFMLSIAIVMGLSIVCRFGSDQMVMRFGSIAHKKADKFLFDKIQYMSFWISLILSVCVSFLILLFSSYFQEIFFSNTYESDVFLYISFILPFYCITYVQSACLKSLGSPAFASFLETGFIAFLTALSIKFYCLLFDVISINTSFILFLISSVVVVLVGQIILLLTKRKAFRGVLNNSDGKYLFYALKTLPDFAFISVVNYSVQWAALVMLGLYASSEDVGIYSIAHRLALTVTLVLVVFNNVFGPKYASLYNEDRNRELKKMAQSSSLIMLLVSSPLIIVLSIFPRFFLELFGVVSEVGVKVLRIILLGQFFNIATGQVGLLLNMTGHQKKMRSLATISGCLMLGSLLFFVPTYGIYASSIIFSVILIFQNLLATIFLKKSLGFILLPSLNFRK
jgi:O-antigen/teichoic acid export membrane protein